MFCCQCDQAAGGWGCTQRGRCGKTAEVANMQDLLIYQLKGIAVYAMGYLENAEAVPKEYIAFIENALIQTLTNVNFEEQDHLRMLRTSKELKAKIKAELPKLQTDREEAIFILTEDRSRILRDARRAGIRPGRGRGEETWALHEAIKQGVKGIAAYSHQARYLGQYDNHIDHFLCRALAATTDPDLPVAELAALVAETGEKAAMAIDLLDQANHQSRTGRTRKSPQMNPDMIIRAAGTGEIRRLFLLEAVMIVTGGEVTILNIPMWFGRIASSPDFTFS